MNSASIHRAAPRLGAARDGAITDRQRPPLGGAELFSTADDMARFYQMMLNDGVSGSRRILKRETVAELTRKQTGDLRARAGMPWRLGGIVFVFMIQRADLRPNPDDSPMRRAYQVAVAAALALRS